MPARLKITQVHDFLLVRIVYLIFVAVEIEAENNIEGEDFGVLVEVW